MTAITAARAERTTRIDRALLSTSEYLDRVVTARIERRANTHSTRVDAERIAVDARATAQAMSGVGMLPR